MNSRENQTVETPNEAPFKASNFKIETDFEKLSLEELRTSCVAYIVELLKKVEELDIDPEVKKEIIKEINFFGVNIEDLKTFLALGSGGMYTREYISEVEKNAHDEACENLRKYLEKTAVGIQELMRTVLKLENEIIKTETALKSIIGKIEKIVDWSIEGIQPALVDGYQTVSDLPGFNLKNLLNRLRGINFGLTTKQKLALTAASVAAIMAPTMAESSELWGRHYKFKQNAHERAWVDGEFWAAGIEARFFNTTDLDIPPTTFQEPNILELGHPELSMYNLEPYIQYGKSNPYGNSWSVFGGVRTDLEFRQTKNPEAVSQYNRSVDRFQANETIYPNGDNLFSKVTPYIGTNFEWNWYSLGEKYKYDGISFYVDSALYFPFGENVYDDVFYTDSENEFSQDTREQQTSGPATPSLGANFVFTWYPSALWNDGEIQHKAGNLSIEAIIGARKSISELFGQNPDQFVEEFGYGLQFTLGVTKATDHYLELYGGWMSRSTDWYNNERELHKLVSQNYSTTNFGLRYTHRNLSGGVGNNFTHSFSAEAIFENSDPFREGTTNYVITYRLSHSDEAPDHEDYSTRPYSTGLKHINSPAEYGPGNAYVIDCTNATIFPPYKKITVQPGEEILVTINGDNFNNTKLWREDVKRTIIVKQTSGIQVNPEDIYYHNGYDRVPFNYNRSMDYFTAKEDANITFYARKQEHKLEIRNDTRNEQSFLVGIEDCSGGIFNRPTPTSGPRFTPIPSDYNLSYATVNPHCETGLCDANYVYVQFTELNQGIITTPDLNATYADPEIGGNLIIGIGNIINSFNTKRRKKITYQKLDVYSGEVIIGVKTRGKIELTEKEKLLIINLIDTFPTEKNKTIWLKDITAPKKDKHKKAVKVR